MDNKNLGFAFPVFDQKGECLPGGAGLTKYEYAAIMIAQGLAATQPDITNMSVSQWDNRKQLIAIRACQLSKQIFKEIELNP